MTAAKTPRRFPLFNLWPLAGIAAIGVFWLAFVLAARVLIPLSDTAHTVIYLANIFVLLPLLIFVAPILLLIQLALLVHWWRRGWSVA